MATLPAAWWLCRTRSFQVAQGCIPVFIPALAISRRLASAVAVSKVDEDQKSILVNWSEGKDSWSKFHFDWLRDNCPCTKCKHPEYHQRLLTTLEDPVPAKVDVEGSDDAVEIEWRDGHRSQYPYSWLIANSYCHNNVMKETGNKRKITLWDSNSTVTANPPEISYNDIMTDDQKLLNLLKNLYQYGFCFVLDTPPTKESMMEAASRVGPIQHSFYGSQWYIEAGNMDVKHISYSRDRVLPHTDSPSLFDSHGTGWLHVIRHEGIEGGTSTLIDGFKLAEHIRKQEPIYYALLSRVSLFYQYLIQGHTSYKMRRRTFTLNDNKEMSAVYLNNIDRKPLDEISLSEAKEVLSCDADEAVTRMYQALRYLHHLLLYDDQFAYRFDLLPGKMIVVNNHRLLHGRDEVISVNGCRGICGAHNCESEWLGTMTMLELKYNTDNTESHA